MKPLLNTKKINKLKTYLFMASFLAWTLLNFCVFWIGTNAQSILLAFRAYNFDYTWAWNGVQNFVAFFDSLSASGSLLKLSLRNSVFSYLLTFIIQTPTSLIFCYFIYKKCRGYKAIRGIVLLPSIVSGYIFTLIFKRFTMGAIPAFMSSLGFENFPNLLTPDYAFGTLVFYGIWLGYAGCVLYIPNAMNQIDEAIIESAKLDGVNMFQELWYIVLPMIMPTQVTFWVTGFSAIISGSLDQVTFFMYDGPPEVYTYGYYMTVKVMTTSSIVGYGELAAGGLVFTMIMGPAILILKRLLDKVTPDLE